MKRTFNIRLWFGVAGLGLIGLICALSAYWIGDFVTRSLLERESEVTQEFFQGVARGEADAIFRSAVGAGPPNDALAEFAKHIINTPGMMRANIYSADRRVLWSTEPQLIGRAFSDNAELEEALKGKRVTETSSLEHHKAEYVAFGQSGLFIEAYLPIFSDKPDPTVLGVVEFYKFPTALNATIAEGRRMVWLLAIGAAAVLYSTLFWIVQRGAAQIERQHRQLVRLQSFAAIGQLATAIAHSLRNPMAAIRSSAELWRGELPSGETNIADEVIQEIDRMDSYVRDLLAYARPQAENMRALDPMTVVDKAIAKRDAGLRRNGILVRRTDRRAHLSNVLVDPILFEHAVTSILDNAIEAMAEGGTLAVAISEGSGGRSVSLGISDNGPGIPHELLDRVAGSYFTTKSRGLGLGLALARGVVERWDGNLAVSSSQGGGTSVSITLKTV
jgi:two-component system sensor histidine kinase HydH